MPVVVDLSDIALLVDSGEQRLLSPGYALLQKDQDPMLGEIALHQSRLSPARAANRFWRELSLNPVGISHHQVRHQADLVWHHIKQLNAELSLDWGRFVTPSHYDEAQLSLLSGILKSQQIRPQALIRRALLGALASPKASYYLEFQLHQVLLTSLRSESGERLATESRAVGSGGQIELVDCLMQGIQKRFIRDTRFDPLHHASTEQQLADSLPDLLSHLTRSDATLALVKLRDEEYRVEVRRDDLADALRPFWDRLAAALPPAAQLVADSGIALYPGADKVLHHADRVAAHELIEIARELPLADTADADAPQFLTKFMAVTQDPDNATSTAKPTSIALPNVTSSTSTSSNKVQDSGASHLLCQGVAMRQPQIWFAQSPAGQLEMLGEQPEQPLAICRMEGAGLELEALGEMWINGEKLVGRRRLQRADYCSSPSASGGVTAIRVLGDGH